MVRFSHGWEHTILATWSYSCLRVNIFWYIQVSLGFNITIVLGATPCSKIGPGIIYKLWRQLSGSLERSVWFHGLYTSNHMSSLVECIPVLHPDFSLLLYPSRRQLRRNSCYHGFLRFFFLYRMFSFSWEEMHPDPPPKSREDHPSDHAYPDRYIEHCSTDNSELF